MIPKFLLFLFLIFSSVAIGQNLVPDPGFEIHNDSCTTNWPGLTHWFNPNTATPDLYNMEEGCGNNLPQLWNQGVETPIPWEGNCYAGLFTSTNVQANSHTREYFFTELTSSLDPGSVYRVQFSVYRDLYYGHAIDMLGISFTAYAPFFDTFEVIPLEPQIETYGAVIQVDSSYWQTFEFYYIAQGGEQYLTIGNFRYAEEMEIVIDQQAGNVNFGYYFFDEIRLELDISSGISIDEANFKAWITNGELIIVTNNLQHFQMYDLTGRQVTRGVATPGVTRKSLNGLYTGVYVLLLQSITGVHSKKLWKE